VTGTTGLNCPGHMLI